MMELKEQRFISASIFFAMLILFYFSSCQKDLQHGKLECLLERINVDMEGKDILVGQHNGWTDSTALIIVVFEKKSMNIPITSSLQGKYNGHDIYFNQGNVDTLDTLKYKQISNSIKWNEFTSKITDDNIIQPPYNPVSVQVEYNISRDCFNDVIRGKGYFTNDFTSKCGCKK